MTERRSLVDMLVIEACAVLNVGRQVSHSQDMQAEILSPNPVVIELRAALLSTLNDYGITDSMLRTGVPQFIPVPLVKSADTDDSEYLEFSDHEWEEFWI